MKAQALKRKYSVSQILVDVISLLFILLFVYAAVSKLLDYKKFRIQLEESPILNPFAGIIVWILPLVECIVSALLAFKKSQLYGLFASFGLMSIFTLYIVDILNFSEYVPCSCGGILQQMSWRQHLLFNAAFLLIGIVGIILNDTKFIDLKIKPA